MERILSVTEREAKCYDYFHTNSIKSREELRECWKEKQIPGVRANFIEDIFSDFILKKKLDEKRRNFDSFFFSLCHYITIKWGFFQDL